MKLKSMVTAIAFLALVNGSQVFAQQSPPPRGGGFMNDWDQNGDGVVSEDEFGGPSEHFSRFDKNSDGVVDQSEAPKGPPPGRHGGQRNFMNLDKDGDGVVSSDEFPGPADVFSKMDQNGDDVIDQSEAPKGPPAGRHGRRGNFMNLDKDGDNVVSGDEFPGPAHVFSKLDQNGNGVIDQSEAPKGPPAGRHGRRGNFMNLDQDGDGVVSSDEFPGPADFFSKLDKNGDGVIDESEAPKGPPRSGANRNHGNDRLSGRQTAGIGHNRDSGGGPSGGRRN